MRPVSKNTAETSTRAVRSSTARLSRVASDSSGASGTRTMVRPSSSPERQGGEEADHQLVGVRPQGDAPSRVSQEPGESLADPLSLSHRVLPLVVHIARRVQPGSHLAIEATIRPGLVGVSGEQEALRYPESGIVGREGVGGGVEGRGVHWVRGFSHWRAGFDAWLFTTETRKTRKLKLQR